METLCYTMEMDCGYGVVFMGEMIMFILQQKFNIGL